MVGKIIGHYEVLDKLGEGGMGVVYKARDTHLDRFVALKVLRPDKVADAERRRRFVQEAKSASALNHPNIVHIYDIAASSDTQYIVMEHIAGKTLDRVLPHKGMPLTQALDHAVQMADALAAAHAANLVHRDLKPANIMVTGDGLVKILDFGLAKLTETAETNAFASTMVEVAARTIEGTILGTVAYMSPEQAEGKPIDSRSDIFSFGSVLYEMVSGQRPFTGGSKLAILSAILRQEPHPLDLPGDTGREVGRIIARCLRKDPARRWQNTRDLKMALDDVRDPARSGMMAAMVRRRRFPTRRVLLGAGAAAGAAGAAWIARRWAAPPPPVYQRITFRRGDVVGARFAPGGNIVYSAEWNGAPVSLFSTRPGNREGRALDLPPSRLLGVSPSGQLAILLGGSAPGTLARVPLEGGVPRQILENVSDADWAPNDKDLAVVRHAGVRQRVEFPIGKVLYESDSRRPPHCPRVSPSGDQVAFWDFDTEVGDYAVVVADARTRRTLTRGWRGTGQLAWAPSGEIWFSATAPGADPALYATTLAGNPRLVSQAPGWIVLHDISAEGRVLFGAVNSRITLMHRAPGASQERDLSWLDTSQVSDLSADASTMVFLELSFGEGRNTAMYLRRTDGSAAMLLGEGNRPVLSPDGRWILCIRREARRSQLLLLPTGPGESRLLPGEGFRYDAAQWFPDGRRILFTGSAGDRPPRSWVQELDGAAPRAVTAEGARGSFPSPDGGSIVVVDRGRLTLAPLDGRPPRVAGTLEPGEAVAGWAAGGRALFLRRIASGGATAGVSRFHLDDGRREPLWDLRPPDAGARLTGAFVITPDGKSYAYSFQRDISNLYMVSGLR